MHVASPAGDGSHYQMPKQLQICHHHRQHWLPDGDSALSMSAGESMQPVKLSHTSCTLLAKLNLVIFFSSLVGIFRGHFCAKISYFVFRSLCSSLCLVTLALCVQCRSLPVFLPKITSCESEVLHTVGRIHQKQNVLCSPFCQTHPLVHLFKL